ncbi:histidinol dehydrogenase [Candidatus Micrarchaeota archaeon]|nr:histidinol dehydrogenase [Candidatus Micrarchaeota archaeon]
MLKNRMPPAAKSFSAKNVEEIVERVRKNGDAALSEFGKKFDSFEGGLEVTKAEQEKALREIPDSLRKALETSEKRIGDFCSKTMPENRQWVDGYFEYEWRWEPIERIGAYAPGGKAAYPSSVLMNVIPAKTAGCGYMSVCTPPKPKDSMLAACALVEVDALFQVGGAQSIAAMAYGTETIPKVDKIVGPGGAFVDAAKRLVSKDVAIDFPAGPSELTVVADKTADAKQIALDLIAQAEHDYEAKAGLLALDEEILVEVDALLEGLVKKTKRREIVERSLQKNGFGLLVTGEEALALLNNYAFEHVALYGSAVSLREKIRNAGAVYVETPVALGDYAIGSNHVLPTAGFARSYGMLSVYDFLKPVVSVQRLRKGLEGTAAEIARSEGLYGHAESV